MGRSEVNYAAVHGACPVRGEASKWVLQRWMLLKPFEGSGAVAQRRDWAI